MEIFTTILAYGYIFIVGSVFLIMAFQILAFYIAGKTSGSIDDEITTAFTLFGALLFIGMASTLVNAVLTTFLTGMMVPAIASFVLYLVVMIYAVVKIYELSIGKSIFFLLFSTLITVALAWLTIFVGTKLIPEGDPKMDSVSEMGSDLNVFGVMEIKDEALDTLEDAMEQAESGMEEAMDAAEGLMIEDEPVEDPEAPTPSGPGLPGTTE